MSDVVDVTVAIVTRDRLEFVRRAVASALAQTGVRLEVIVIDDGSVDGTAATLRQEFPSVRVEALAEPLRQMAGRNQAMRMAGGEYVVTIDDDAFFESPRTVAQTVACFDHPRIAAVTIPYVNARQETFLRQAPMGAGGAWGVGVFAAGACAFRRAAFLDAGGYAEDLVYQEEEADLALRLVARGHVIRLGDADPITHWEANPVKPAHAHFFSARNSVLLTSLTVPQPYLAPRLAVVAAHTVWVGSRHRHLGSALRGCVSGMKVARARWAERSPAPRWAYVLTRQLRRNGPRPVPQLASIAERRVRTG